MYIVYLIGCAFIGVVLTCTGYPIWDHGLSITNLIILVVATFIWSLLTEFIENGVFSYSNLKRAIRCVLIWLFESPWCGGKCYACSMFSRYDHICKDVSARRSRSRQRVFVFSVIIALTITLVISLYKTSLWYL